jgi:tetratricopeptide (TPR) repeat protein
LIFDLWKKLKIKIPRSKFQGQRSNKNRQSKTENSFMAIKSIKLKTATGRALIGILMIICLAVGYFFVRWCFANTIAARVISLEDKPKEVAALAIDWAPNDPQTHFASALLHEKTFLPDDLPKSLEEYEKATALSPHDFRLWFELGKARERSGDAAGAHLALNRALQLAPNYAQVQWTLGNFLLRQGRAMEAFAEIRRAAASDQDFSNPAVSIAWQIFEGDIAEIKQHIGDSAHLKSSFAALLAREKRFDESLQVWNSLPEADRKTIFRSSGEEIYQKMIEAKKYRTALEVFSQITEAGERGLAVGEITNGGFEAPVSKNPSIFQWQIADGTEPQIGVDNTQKRGGTLSLTLVFNNSDAKTFRTVSQSVAVEAGKKYLFETFYKADLKTSATLRWEVMDASDGKVLASTEAIAANSDWTNLRTEFITPESAEAVTIRLVRANCASTMCPISGRVWFDDFKLE